MERLSGGHTPESGVTAMSLRPRTGIAASQDAGVAPLRDQQHSTHSLSGLAVSYMPFKFESRRSRIDWRMLHTVDVNRLVSCGGCATGAAGASVPMQLVHAALPPDGPARTTPPRRYETPTWTPWNESYLRSPSVILRWKTRGTWPRSTLSRQGGDAPVPSSPRDPHTVDHGQHAGQGAVPPRKSSTAASARRPRAMPAAGLGGRARGRQEGGNGGGRGLGTRTHRTVNTPSGRGIRIRSSSVSSSVTGCHARRCLD